MKRVGRKVQAPIKNQWRYFETVIDMILCEDWTRNFLLLTKSHKLINFTLESRALNPIVRLGWNFA